jgi:hypothetical protein
MPCKKKNIPKLTRSPGNVKRKKQKNVVLGKEIFDRGETSHWALKD